MVYELKLPTTEVELKFKENFSHADFEALCFANKDLLIEREPDGIINIMAPASPNSSDNEAEFIAELKIYSRKHGGKSYSSQGGFTLPDGSVRMADASYVSAEQIAKFSYEDLNHFAEIVPEFVVEVISPSDSIKDAMIKMQNVWIGNGVKLGWLVNVPEEKLWIYRLNGSVELIEGFDRTIDADVDVVPGFTFDLRNLL